MKRTNTLEIRQVVDEILKEYKIDGKIKESRIISAWREVLGPLAKSTQNIYIKNKNLFVSINSSVVRNELIMQRSLLLKKLNEKAGEKIIENIVFS